MSDKKDGYEIYTATTSAAAAAAAFGSCFTGLFFFSLAHSRLSWAFQKEPLDLCFLLIFFCYGHAIEFLSCGFFLLSFFFFFLA